MSDSTIVLVAAKLRKLTDEVDSLSKQQGPKGDQGDPGPKGDRGDVGQTGLPPAHEWIGTKLRFKLPDGKWGKPTDLKGAPGERGSVGAVSVASAPSDASSNFHGKTLVWAQGVLSEVLLYLDAAKTQLAERRVLNRTGSTLTSIDFFDGAGAPTKTRTLSYSSGALTGVTEA